MERTLIKFVCSWRKISRKDAYRGVSESAYIVSSPSLFLINPLYAKFTPSRILISCNLHYQFYRSFENFVPISLFYIIKLYKVNGLITIIKILESVIHGFIHILDKSDKCFLSFFIPFIDAGMFQYC